MDRLVNLKTVMLSAVMILLPTILYRVIRTVKQQLASKPGSLSTSAHNGTSPQKRTPIYSAPIRKNISPPTTVTVPMLSASAMDWSQPAARSGKYSVISCSSFLPNADARDGSRQMTSGLIRQLQMLNGKSYLRNEYLSTGLKSKRGFVPGSLPPLLYNYSYRFFLLLPINRFNPNAFYSQ